VLILFSIIIAGILLINLEEDKSEEVKLYTFPISVGEETYVISVRSNYSVSEVSYFGILRYVSVDFRGSLRETVFCEITVPTDLIWGELSVYKKDYIQSDDSYIMSNNGTHHSVQMIFYHIATVEVISIRGTEGVTESPSPTTTPTPTLTSDSSSLPTISAYFEGPLGGFGITSPSNNTCSSNILTLVVSSLKLLFQLKKT